MRFPEFCYGTSLYQLLLRGPTPRHLACVPPHAWPGSPTRGASIVDGTLRLAGQALATSTLWSQPQGPGLLAAELHSFTWLDDLAALGDVAASDAARQLIGSWLDAHGRWNAISWHPDVLGARVANWLTHARLIARGDDDPLGARIMGSLAQQLRHLSRVATTSTPGTSRLTAVRGLVFGAVCGLAPARLLGTATRSLSREVNAQILPDGGHAARAPAEQLRALAALVDIRDMLTLAGQQMPADLLETIGRMAEMLALYRHPDGRLALFNGSSEGDETLIESVMARAAPTNAARETAEHAGFERLNAAHASVILDCGAPPESGYDDRGHAGTLSFEMSCGRERIVVNCGAQSVAEPAWQTAQRSTAAHSTISVDDTNSSEVLPAGGFRRRAQIVDRSREHADGNVWVTASHDGYRPDLGLIHRRRLYMARDGHDLRGEDTLTGTHRGYVTARFHLHPDVRVSLLQNGAAVLLRLRSGIAWRFQATGGRIELAESIYIGAAERRRTEQITLNADLQGNGAQLKWAFKRLAA